MPFVWSDETNPKVGLTLMWLGRISTRWTRPIRRKLRALKFDWGRNDGMVFVRLGSQMFSKRLENIGINHYAEEYIGTHGNKIYSEDGRVLNNMLPFFNTYLKFEEVKFKTVNE
jgi:hypothetical protein